MLKLETRKFLLSEAKRFFTSAPQIVLFIGAIVSAILMYACKFSEETRAILEGIVSGYIFYFFVDVFPKSEKRASSAKKVAGELNAVLESISTFKAHVKDEILAIGQQIQNGDKFFSLLQNVTGTHIPTTKNMKRINGTTPASATQPLQFHYANMEEVMKGEVIRLVHKLESLERISAIYGLADLDEELMRAVSDIPNRQLFSSGIHAIGHIKNTPAMFASDFDWIEESLLKIKDSLQLDWKVRFD